MWCAHKPQGVSCTHPHVHTHQHTHSPSYPHCVFEQLGPCKHSHLNTPTTPSTDTWSIPRPLHGKCFPPSVSGQDSPFSHESLLSYLWSGGNLGRILGSLPVAQLQLPRPAQLCLNTRSGECKGWSTIKGMRTNLCRLHFLPSSL